MYESDFLVSIKRAPNTCRGHFMKMEELWAVLVFKEHHNFSLKIHISLYLYSLLQYSDMKSLLCFFGKQNWNPDIFAHPPRPCCWANWLILTVHSAQDVSKIIICVYAGSQCWKIAAAATGQRRFLHWGSSTPVPPREDWEGWVQGWWRECPCRLPPKCSALLPTLPGPCTAPGLWHSLGAPSWDSRDQQLSYSNLQRFNNKIMTGIIGVSNVC